MLTWIKRLLLATTLLALIASNVLTLTNTAFNAALSGLLGTTLGVQTVSGALRGKVKSQQRTMARHKAITARQKAATRRFGTRLANRTRRVAAKSIAAIPAESIPFIGVAVLIADTGYELYAACETVQDLDQLYRDLGMPDDTPEEVMLGVCNPQLPEADKVWSDVMDQVDAWWDRLAEAA